MKHFLNRLHDWWSTPAASRAPPEFAAGRSSVLLVVEGVNDIHFLQNISAILSRSDPSFPDLQSWELEGRCHFLPTGGDVAAWTLKLAALRLPQVHLYDRETGITTDGRRAHVSLLNLQPHLRAFLTGKRSLENYLHSAAVLDGLGIDVVIDDEISVADAVAQAIHQNSNPGQNWETLLPRARRKRRDRAKRGLNTVAVRHMTAERLAERDPQGDLVGWLRTICELAMRG